MFTCTHNDMITCKYKESINLTSGGAVGLEFGHGLAGGQGVDDGGPLGRAQNVGAAPSGGPNIRDRSTKQPWLPVEKTTWDNWRFMLRARRVRVSGPNKLKLKLVLSGAG